MKSSQATTLAIVAAAIILSILGIRYLNSENENGPESIRLGINLWPGYEYLFIAQKEAFFKKHGVEIELVELGSLSDVRQAFENGDIDGMASTLIEVMMAYRNSNRLAQACLATDFSDGADVILSNKEFDSITALKGKRIGVEFSSLGVFVLARALEKANMQMTDVQLVNLTQDEVVEAVSEGRIDAAMTYPPKSIQLIQDFEMREVFNTSEIPAEVVDVVSFDSSLLERQPEIATAIGLAWRDAFEWVDKNRDEAFAFMAKRYELSPKEFEMSFEGMRLLALEDQAPLFVKGGNLYQAMTTINRVVIEPGTDMPEIARFIFP